MKKLINKTMDLLNENNFPHLSKNELNNTKNTLKNWDLSTNKENINKGFPFAKKALELDPNLAKANHWYAVIFGKQGELEGTKQKILNSYDVKKYCLKAIELDPNYQNGGGYFMLGAIHYKSPYIPFILSWPNNNDAIKFLQLAHDTGRATLNQKNYLAQAIHKDGQI